MMMIPRCRSDYREPGLRDEPLWRLPRARVVLCHAAALERDFPGLRAEAMALPRGPRDEPPHHRWLLHHAARISGPQAVQSTVNTPIEILGPALLGFRPPRYGRSAVVPTRSGLLDLKGVGVAPGVVPRPVAHADGLLLLGEALEELAFQRLIAAVFEHSGARLSTVETYAIIDTGFLARTSGGMQEPAAIMVRRAHRRPTGGVELPLAHSLEERTKLEAELLLRHYGITSCNEGTRTTLCVDPRGLTLRYGGVPQRLSPRAEQRIRAAIGRSATGRIELDGVNVQLTGDVSRSSSTLVDFGQYEARRRFVHPVMNLRRELGPRWGAICWPHDQHFVQPHPRLGVARGRWAEDRLSRTAWFSSLAAHWSGGRIDEHGILREIDTMSRAARYNWP